MANDVALLHLPTGPSAPATLSLADLSQLVGHHAELYRAGAYPDVAFSTPERWHRRVYCDGRVDVWLISWLSSQSTRLHDHGISSGAFTVLDGELTEVVAAGWSDGWMSLRPLARPRGSTVTFERHHIHDVVNRGSAPAVSVHAYSPPLTSMRFYDFTNGDLALTRTLATNDPEPDEIVACAS